jgi:hypothetical protein
VLGFYKFSEVCLGPYYVSKISNETIEDVEQKELEPSLQIGIRDEKLGKLLYYNKGLQKLVCLNSNELKKVSLSQIFGPYQTRYLRELIKT